ncbi:MAG: hypothetical protein H3C31_07170 [Brumimicrobium sp.]|nr:hypothetical protein [Brumimicrobium sp.]MCO5267837.1 FtsL-like putative cell division protein [Brumimicrobium sp.]
MKDNNYIPENANPIKKDKKRKPSKESKKRTDSIAQIMNGDFLTKDFVLNNLNYIFFLIFLMVLIVSKGYYVTQLTNDISDTEKNLRNINADYVETKAKLEEMTRRSEMIKRLEPLELKETVNPVKVIRIKEKKKG